MNEENNNAEQIIKGICEILGTGEDLPDGEIKSSLEKLNEINIQIDSKSNDEAANTKKL